MSFKQDLRSVWAALRCGSPVVVDVPPAIRFVLLHRYMDMSMRNGRLSLASSAILMFGLAMEAPLLPRIVAWIVLAAVFGARVVLARRMLRRLDPADPRSDRFYDALVLLASSIWGWAPIVLHGWVSELAQYCVTYAAFVATALLAITYIAALPASVLMVSASALPLIGFMALQGPTVMVVLAFGTLVCAVALQLRVFTIHGTLLQALAAERQNAELVQELQSYRRTLETENATLDSSLRAAAQAANRDPLTGLFNRRHVDAMAVALADNVRTRHEAVAVCVVDVDHFKLVNDRLGHQAGDAVLQSVGRLLGTRLRDGDCLARFGGEEFVVILRRCDVNRGLRVAEALRRNVAAEAITTELGPVQVTVSIGLAQWGEAESIDDVIERADRALYNAKQSGRDRVEVDDADAANLNGQPLPSTMPSGL